MNDLDTRLRETLDTVAQTTLVTERIDEIRRPHPRARRGVTTAALSFGAVILVLGVPLLLSLPNTDSQQSLAAPLASTNTSTVDGFVVDPEWLTVDEEDLAVFAALAESGSDVHGPGWRHSLRTEAVWCLHEGGTGADTTASEFPIEDNLTMEVLTAECAYGNDSARNLESPPETLSFCRGVFTESVYQEWADSAEYEVIAGEVGGTLPGFPVVLGWESDCVSEQLDTTMEVVLSDDLSLSEINRARQLEIAVTGASYDNCFDYNQASNIADAVRETLGSNWLRVEFTAVQRDIAGYCYQPVIDLQWGAVYVGGVDRPTVEDPNTSTTEPPTTVPPAVVSDPDQDELSGDRRYDTASALVWQSAVLEVTGQLADDGAVISSWETPQAVSDGGSVTTEVQVEGSGLRLVFDFQAWSEGEYQDDPDWIAREGAGSTTPGVTTEKGTLFTFDGSGFSHATLVSPYGVLFIVAENSSTAASDLAVLAEQLIEEANGLVGGA